MYESTVWCWPFVHLDKNYSDCYLLFRIIIFVKMENKELRLKPPLQQFSSFTITKSLTTNYFSEFFSPVIVKVLVKKHTIFTVHGKQLNYWCPRPSGLHCRYNLTSVINVCKAALISLFWGAQQTQQITKNVFQISLQPDWQTDNGIFNRPIMVHTQILVHRWRPRTRISVLFCRPNQRF